ncbi:MAG: LCP family protein [Chloroflexi bacterium]|nr:LCP family protein [Chloroflexota bacterium]
MNRRPNTARPDPNAYTQPVTRHDPYARTQPMTAVPKSRKRGCACSTCLGIPLGSFILLGVIALAVYLLAPMRTNLLILGIDRAPEGTDVSRTDTIILTTFVPLKPTIGMLSIPRDLWVPIPGHGENRINTAHFFAEAEQPGSGPQAAIQVVEDNFKVQVPYYLRIRFDGFEKVVDAMGGVTVDLPSAMSGMEAGEHHLNGAQALAFARDRKGSDDFFRMERGQILLKSALRQMLNPLSWLRLPAAMIALGQTVDTNLPAWQWPRLALALLRAGPGGIDSRTIDREMVTPFVTSGGADVLGPNWDQILPVVREMFGG